MNRDRPAVAQFLREHGVTPTRQRVDIACVLFARRHHLSADQILDAVNATAAKTSKATVYNTLKVLVERRLVRELVVDPSKIYYDSNVDPHHHFYNIDTGELTDFPAEGVAIAGLPALPAGTVADGVDVIVRTRRLDRATDR